jgi:hypothetical protein
MHTGNRNFLGLRMKNIIQWFAARVQTKVREHRHGAAMRGLRGALKVGPKVSCESMNER